MNVRLSREIDLAAATPDTGNPLWPIVKVGTFESRSGKVTVTEADIDAMQASYDPKIERSAINVDHKDEGPAFGSFARLEKRRVNGEVVLFGEVQDLDPKLREDVRNRRYFRGSAEITRRHAVTKGVYLHGFSVLGARRAAVKGLELTLSEEADAVLEFQAAPDETTPGATAPSTNPPEPGEQEHLMKKTTPPAAGEPAAPATTPEASAPAAAGAGSDANELEARVEQRLASLGEKEKSLSAMERRLARKESEIKVAEDLAACGKRITPAMLKAGLKGLLVELHLQGSELSIDLAGSDGKPAPAHAYDVLLKSLKALPDVLTPLGAELADSDEGALEASLGATPEQQQVALAAGISADEQKRLRAKYPGFYGGPN